MLKKRKEVNLSTKQKLHYVFLLLTFIVMIIGFIPWGEFDITFFDRFTGWLTGSTFR